MKKTFTLFLTLAAMLISSTANAADTYDNVEGTLTWTNGNETAASISDAIANAFLETGFSVGTSLSVSGPTSYSATIPEATTSLMTYLCSSNPGIDPGVMIEYKVKVKKGLTFTPTSVVFDAVKEGTDNAYFGWSYTVDGTESDVTLYDSPKTQIRRNSNVNPEAPLTHNESITAAGGREFSLRFYITNAANKKMSIGNIKINGKVNGTEEGRAFKDIAINFQTNPYTVVKPADGKLPEGVTVEGEWHDNQHGYNSSTVTVPVDGPVKITFGNCQYNGFGATVKKGDEVLATIDCKKDCSTTTTWYYNKEEAATLTIITPQYCPSLTIEACEPISEVEVTYFNTDGSVIGTETILGGSPLAYKYGKDDVKVEEGQAFRGWFNSDKEAAVKIPEGYTLQEALKLYARATKIEVPTSTSRFNYDLTKPYFYAEDHEAITIDGKYYNEHGWIVDKGGTIKVNVAGKAYISVGKCQYSKESTATVTDENGTVITTFPVKATGDGAEYTFPYDGDAGWLTITFPEGSYTHSVSVWNVVEFVEYDEQTGYYNIPAGDVSSFLVALKDAASKEGAKIFLPNGTYDLGTTVLTGVSGKNISIIGESREGTVIVNAPLAENEGIERTATLKNSSENLYMQDLTLRNAMTFTGATGRGVTLQDCGTNTICKNVSLESYQDTYYSNNNSGYFYFEDGEIHGVVDYVCGGGDVYFNHVKFVNEAIKDATVAAPNGGKKFGYVMNRCTIETLCSKFNLGRSWGTYSGLAWLNTTINQPEKLIETRFNTAGMNCAADKFREYNTCDTNGTVISPTSNVLEFTHSTGNKKYETILTAEEAAEYELNKVFPGWTPDQIAAQVQYAEGETLDGNIYLVDGKIYKGSLPTGEIKVRKANARGGFGPEVTTTYDPTAVTSATVSTAKTLKAVYNTAGQRVSQNSDGIKIFVYSDGTAEKKVNN
ncbi:MAG: hypothetical protein HUK08_05155 [Bacteroidaceae bacterium]|nr:hypothetical protein [Bacteroidaceae bacterium]